MTQLHASPKIAIVSEHDYRTARHANIHAIADALVRLGYQVTFISIRYSALSLLKSDSRNFLWRRANRLEFRNGISCYLWMTPLHPFHPRGWFLRACAAPLYRLYSSLPNLVLDEALRSASFIIVESGLGVMFLRRARQANGSAVLIYRASDNLDAIGAHPILQRQAETLGDAVDQVCLVTRKMAPRHAWAGDRLFCVPHGIDPSDFATGSANPYTAKENAVSVGSMLFDPSFFVHAGRLFPQVEFHVIGCGSVFDAPANVRIHPEMSFKSTIPFIEHATFGIAPYRMADNAEYLSESSLKLLQYEYLRIPAVCPHFAVGNSPNRFGYRPGDPSSIRAAIDSAMERSGKVVPQEVLTWEDVARRLLEPKRFSDTRV